MSASEDLSIHVKVYDFTTWKTHTITASLRLMDDGRYSIIGRPRDCKEPPVLGYLEREYVDCVLYKKGAR